MATTRAADCAASPAPSSGSTNPNHARKPVVVSKVRNQEMARNVHPCTYARLERSTIRRRRLAWGWGHQQPVRPAAETTRPLLGAHTTRAISVKSPGQQLSWPHAVSLQFSVLLTVMWTRCVRGPNHAHAHDGRRTAGIDTASRSVWSGRGADLLRWEECAFSFGFWCSALHPMVRHGVINRAAPLAQQQARERTLRTLCQLHREIVAQRSGGTPLLSTSR